MKYKKSVLNYIMVFLLSCSGNAVASTDIVMLTNASDVIKTGKIASVFTDDDGESTFETVMQLSEDNWTRQNKWDNLNFGYTSKIRWVRFQVQNNAENSDWVISIPYSVLDSIHLYMTDQNGLIMEKSAGRFLPFHKRDYHYRAFAFKVTIPEQSLRTVYIRATSHDTLALPIHIVPRDQFIIQITNEQIIFGLYYGILLAMILYNSFLLFTFREKSYLYYVLTLIFFHLLFHISMNGFWSQYFFKNAFWSSRTSIAIFLNLGSMTTLLFTKYFLNTPKRLFILDRLLTAGAFIHFFLFIASFFVNYYIIMQTSVGTSMVFALIASFAAIVSLRLKVKEAGFYLLAFSGYEFCGFIFGLKAFAVLPSNGFTEYGFQVSGAMMTILMTFAISDKINRMQKDLEYHRNHLEHEVASRTVQFEQTNERLTLINKRVKELINTIKHHALSISKEMKDIRNISNTLAKGASVQEDSVKRISARMKQIKNQVKSNAENASIADSVSQKAIQSSMQTVEQMKSMESAISEMIDSNTTISKIINTIDSIAFQTNLLAINAAIEAARAGKNGKGFDVVAREVKILANRSASAANETTVIIENSIITVEKGSHRSIEAARMLDEIHASISSITELINGISKASSEQSAALNDISLRIDEINSITAKNSEDAVTASNSAEHLAMAIEELHSLIATIDTEINIDQDVSELSPIKIHKNEQVYLSD